MQLGYVARRVATPGDTGQIPNPLAQQSLIPASLRLAQNGGCSLSSMFRTLAETHCTRNRIGIRNRIGSTYRNRIEFVLLLDEILFAPVSKSYLPKCGIGQSNH